MQTAFNDQPSILMSPYLSTMGQFVEAYHFPGGGEGTSTLAPTRPILVEQMLQGGLLGVVSQNLSPEAVPVLTRCLRSSGALVAERAERLLARLGRAVVPDLLVTAAKTRSDLQRARLLEVCRCSAPSAALGLAREHLASDHMLVAAAAAQVIGEAGTEADVPALCERLGHSGSLWTCARWRRWAGWLPRATALCLLTGWPPPIPARDGLPTAGWRSAQTRC